MPEYQPELPELQVKDEDLRFLNHLAIKKEIHTFADQLTTGHLGLIIQADPNGKISMMSFGNMTHEILQAILELTYESITTESDI